MDHFVDCQFVGINKIRTDKVEKYLLQILTDDVWKQEGEIFLTSDDAIQHGKRMNVVGRVLKVHIFLDPVAKIPCESTPLPNNFTPCSRKAWNGFVDD